MSFKFQNGKRLCILRASSEEIVKEVLAITDKVKAAESAFMDDQMPGLSLNDVRREFQETVDRLINENHFQFIGFLGGSKSSPKVMDHRGHPIGPLLPGDIFSTKLSSEYENREAIQ